MFYTLQIAPKARKIPIQISEITQVVFLELVGTFDPILLLAVLMPFHTLTACGGTPRKLVAAVSMQRTTDYADSLPESSRNVDNGVCNRFT